MKDVLSIAVLYVLALLADLVLLPRQAWRWTRLTWPRRRPKP